MQDLSSINSTPSNANAPKIPPLILSAPAPLFRSMFFHNSGSSVRRAPRPVHGSQPVYGSRSAYGSRPTTRNIDNMFMFRTPTRSRSNTQPGTPRMSMNMPTSMVPSAAYMRSKLSPVEMNYALRMGTNSGGKPKAKAKVEPKAEPEAEPETKETDADAAAKAAAKAEADMKARVKAKALAKAKAKAAALAKAQRAKEEAAAARARIPTWERSKFDTEQAEKAEKADPSDTPYGV